MTSTVKTFNLFSFKRLSIAFITGFGIYFAAYLLLTRGVGGIFAMLLSPFLCLYNTAKVFVFVLLAGLGLYNGFLCKIWFNNGQLYKILMLAGFIGFISGTLLAEYAYFDLNNQYAAQLYDDYLTTPSFFILLFSQSFKPDNLHS